MRVLVCGSRDYNNYYNIFTSLDLLNVANEFTTVIEGEASGADSYARRWAHSRGIPVEKYPADWNRYGKAAGPIRNKQMLEEGQPDMVVAFPKGSLSESKGTKNMVQQAQKAGVPVIVVDDSGEFEHLPHQYMINEAEEPGPLA